MQFDQHISLTGNALKDWIIAQAQDSLAVGLLWLVGLYLLGVPWAPLWALLAAALQIIPHFGPILGLLGPVLAATLRWVDWEHPLYVLMLYAGIVMVDGFVLQPYLMSELRRCRYGLLSRSHRSGNINSVLGILYWPLRYSPWSMPTNQGDERR